MPPSRVVARMFAPADSSICTSAASPFVAAQWSAVMPSPCAAFTSAPFFNSVLTAAASRALAASATSDEDALTPTAADNIRAATRNLRLNDIEVHRPGAVAELVDVDADRIQGREHGVRHRRPVFRLDVTI